MGLNSTYKQKHKPVQEGKTKYHQGYYIPELHPEKCLSLGQNIYRSSWEYQFYSFCDRCDAVKRWASEPIQIPYLNPVKHLKQNLSEGRDINNPMNWGMANYNVDVWIELEGSDGNPRKIFIEIKPHAQTIAPVMPPPGSKPAMFKAFNNAAMTYAVNSAKWAAAKKFCEERGCEFMIVDEIVAKKWGIKFG